MTALSGARLAEQQSALVCCDFFKIIDKLRKRQCTVAMIYLTANLKLCISNL